jgi:ActR/RegA family two-component response regulator
MPQSVQVLVVDDDPAWPRQYKYRLEKEGIHNMDIAHTKEQALQMVSHKSYDLAVIDLRLVDDDQENFDGIEIIEKIREGTHPTKIIVMSGFLSTEIKEVLDKLEANEVLGKDEPIQRFVSCAKDILGKV